MQIFTAVTMQKFVQTLETAEGGRVERGEREREGKGKRIKYLRARVHIFWLFEQIMESALVLPFNCDRHRHTHSYMYVYTLHTYTHTLMHTHSHSHTLIHI